MIAGRGEPTMKFLLPPSRADVTRNARLLVEDWRGGGPLQRYFIASQVASGMLVGVCSVAAIAAGIAGLPGVNARLLGAAALCFVHTAATWHVLKTRFQVRYEVW
jgi:hypothetical protein